MLAKQFPITFQEIRSGLVRGRERIVTMNNGIYGWHEHRDLHLIHKYDARGALVSHDFLTTIDGQEVRTELDFQENESAVIEPVPATVHAPALVNARVLQYDDNMIRVLLNGHTEATLDVFVGAEYFGGHDAYRVTRGSQTTTIKEEDGTLKVPLTLDGQTKIIIQRFDDVP